jgi:Variant SH3 domain
MTESFRLNQIKLSLMVSILTLKCLHIPNCCVLSVRGSLEPGWLEGTLNGKTGLVPENYVEFLP